VRNNCVEWRREVIDRLELERREFRTTAHPPSFVQDPVTRGLSDIGLQVPCLLNANLVYLTPHAERRILRDILRIVQVAGATWQSPVDPAPKPAEQASEHAVERVDVALPPSTDKASGRRLLRSDRPSSLHYRSRGTDELT
jgi:hypothetical protein